MHQPSIFSQGGEKMNIDTINANTVAPPRGNEPTQQVDRQRKEAKAKPQQGTAEQNKVQAEELLTEIKTLTDNGAYSVRFEKNEDSQELIVKVVDQETDEVIRQIPPEELVNLSKHLRELQGNIVDTVS
jgi:flagellar protein FlaG